MSPSLDPIRRSLEERASALGIDRIGICSPDLPPEAERFERWLERSFHGSMGWMAGGRERRLDPSKLLKGIRSILVGALACPPPGRAAPATAGSEPRGRVARYASGEDYHRLLGGRLRALARHVEELFPGAKALEYVDTGAILERMWAAKAGVGWVGKNAMVLNRAMGSHFTLGVILTTAEIPPDEPALDQCGACALCIEACPTGAIVEERMVDSRRCLSYHTIELRGPIPQEFRGAIGDRLVGCDDCQDACPWNSGASPAGGPPLWETIGLTFESWDLRFRRSAVRRATWQGLRRNAIAALGNETGDEAARRRSIADLSRIASNPEEDPVIREQAEWSIRKLGGA